MKLIVKKLSGSAILLTIFILAGIFVVALGVSYRVFFSIRAGDTQSQSLRAYYAAEAGLEELNYELKGGCVDGVLTRNFANRSSYQSEVACYNTSTFLMATSTGMMRNNEINFVKDNPPYFPSLALYLRADGNVDTRATGTDVFVTNWYDASNNLNDAVQTTDSLQPLLIANELNDQPVVRFGNGSATYLDLSSVVDLTSYTVMMVYKFNDCPAANPLYYILGGENQGFFGAGNDDFFYRYGVYNGVAILGADEPSSCDWRIVAINNDKLFKNGIEATYRYNNVVSPITFSRVGARNDSGTPNWPFKGDVAEILVYNQELTPTQRQAVEKYLGQKYNLPVQP